MWKDRHDPALTVPGLPSAPLMGSPTASSQNSSDDLFHRCTHRGTEVPGPESHGWSWRSRAEPRPGPAPAPESVTTIFTYNCLMGQKGQQRKPDFSGGWRNPQTLDQDQGPCVKTQDCFCPPPSVSCAFWAVHIHILKKMAYTS